ncbi:MAG: phosphatase [Rubrivivax sp.]|jgi:membrane-associated phospholipid phosphatase
MDSLALWRLFTRLGEAQILLPAMALALWWLWRTPRTRPLALHWALATAAGAALTTASKLAFMGWRVGYAPWDYTGISGHAFFAAAVLPVLARVAAGPLPRPWPRLAVGAGVALAAAIAYSRLPTHAHSASEALLGFALGCAASLPALRRSAAPQAPTPWVLPAALVAWLLALPLQAPPSRTHDWVQAWSVELSGRHRPFTRADLHRPPGHDALTRAVLGGLRHGPGRQVQQQPVAQR